MANVDIGVSYRSHLPKNVNENEKMKISELLVRAWDYIPSSTSIFYFSVYDFSPIE